ncbi:TetR/AcrR family transcriptional regulator [Ruegeria sp. R13_0]|uniref:TetR/AcrR family transcriptional regulator n=1 Tax=Ruegeria sp. R13_0 TaxID=2821099 RepID=UPI001ADA1684|nr:TetR/AcrR family transcriptional regulator [Ruegeria sp. R13_0]MBO9436991.1 TetR/AcrR family transcriptional regulator [Ruegeria sp. R13_0]
MERNSSDVNKITRPRRKPAGAAVLQDKVTEAIQRALFEEWAETGYSALRMERIAARAGVGKAALYRRSKSKFELVTEAVKSTATRITPIPDTGSFEGDVAMMLRRMAATLRHPLVRRILPDLHAEHARSDELAELLESVTRDRRAQAMVMLDRAVQRCELSEQTDRRMVLDMLIAPLYWHVIVQHRSVRPTDIRRFTNLVLSVSS